MQLIFVMFLGVFWLQTHKFSSSYETPSSFKKYLHHVGWLIKTKFTFDYQNCLLFLREMKSFTGFLFGSMVLQGFVAQLSFWDFSCTTTQGSVAQLYRALDFGSSGRRLESCRGHRTEWVWKTRVIHTHFFSIILFWIIFYDHLGRLWLALLLPIHTRCIRILKHKIQMFLPIHHRWGRLISLHIYLYTIQEWLKGVNTSDFYEKFDPGKTAFWWCLNH